MVGLLLIGFHIGQICVFGWGFHTNMLMLALVFLPVYQWTPRVVAWWEAMRRLAATRSGARWSHALRCGSRLTEVVAECYFSLTNSSIFSVSALTFSGLLPALTMRTTPLRSITTNSGMPSAL